MLKTENSLFKKEGLEPSINTVQGCLFLCFLFKHPVLAVTADRVLLGEVAF